MKAIETLALIAYHTLEDILKISSGRLDVDYNKKSMYEYLFYAIFFSNKVVNVSCQSKKNGNGNISIDFETAKKYQKQIGDFLCILYGTYEGLTQENEFRIKSTFYEIVFCEYSEKDEITSDGDTSTINNALEIAALKWFENILGTYRQILSNENDLPMYGKDAYTYIYNIIFKYN